MHEYFYTYRTMMKEKWLGNTILNIFTTYFPSRNKKYYEDAIKLGIVRINEQIVNISYCPKMNDCITHTIHHHEPVLNSLDIISLENDYVVLNKPPGIACHPTGGYNNFSITEFLYKNTFKNKRDESYVSLLLEEKRKLADENCIKFDKEKHKRILKIKSELDRIFKLGCVNRLDVLTSGILIVAFKNMKKYHEMIEKKLFKKVYLAKVRGFFPRKITVSQKLLKVGNFTVIDNEKGKEAITDFKLYDYDGEYSLILCYPITGKCHQIRVHLNYLNFPILHDPIYNSEFSLSKYSLVENQKDLLFENSICPAVGNTEEEKFMVRHCKYLNTKAYRNIDLYICLHAYIYQFDSKFYKTDLPNWAIE